PKTSIICSPMTSLKTSIKTITYLSDIGCLEIQGASLVPLEPTFYRQISLLAKEKPVEGSPLFLLQMCMEQLVAIGKI
ncbi:hypothetical protein AB4P03_03485, partial [Escherichia coli]